MVYVLCFQKPNVTCQVILLLLLSQTTHIHLTTIFPHHERIDRDHSVLFFFPFDGRIIIDCRIIENAKRISYSSSSSTSSSSSSSSSFFLVQPGFSSYPRKGGGGGRNKQHRSCWDIAISTLLPLLKIFYM